jgi:hypothetical protein
LSGWQGRPYFKEMEHPPKGKGSSQNKAWTERAAPERLVTEMALSWVTLILQFRPYDVSSANAEI